MKDDPEYSRLLVACRAFLEQREPRQVGDQIGYQDAESYRQKLVGLEVPRDGEVYEAEAHQEHDALAWVDLVEAGIAQEVDEF